MRFASTPSPAPQTPQGRNLIYAQGLPAGTYGPKYLYGVGAFQTLRILHQGPQAGLVVTILWDDDTASTWDTHSDVYTFTADANGNSYLDICVPVRGTNATIQLDNCSAGGLLQVSAFTGYHAPFASQYSATLGLRTGPGLELRRSVAAAGSGTLRVPLPTWSGRVDVTVLATAGFGVALAPAADLNTWMGWANGVGAGPGGVWASSIAQSLPREPVTVNLYASAASTFWVSVVCHGSEDA